MIFSWFKSKTSPASPNLNAGAKEAVDQLRNKFSDETLAQGFAINQKVDRLGSRKLEYFNELLGITDDVADRIWPIFEGFSEVNVLEVNGLFASIVTTAVHSCELPTDEKRQIIDIYLDLWAGGMVAQSPTLNGSILRGSIDRMWQGLMPGILRAAAHEEAVKMGFENPPAVLLKALDDLCGVQRPDGQQAEAASMLKDAIIYGFLAVRSQTI